MWEEIKVLELEIGLVAIDEIRLPVFRENTLRVALGTSFRQTVCVTPLHGDCRKCHLQSLCAYRNIFSPLEKSKLRTGGPTYPYISFFAPDTPLFFKPGDSFQFSLRLFGPAVKYYPYFYFCLENLGRGGIGLRNREGKRGRFVLNRIEEINHVTGRLLVFSRGSPEQPLAIKGFSLADYVDCPRVDRLSLVTLSPLRLKHQNRLDDSTQFHIVMRSALRRVSNLYFLATGRLLQVDYRELIARAEQVRLVDADVCWHDYSRYSTTQKCSMKLGGLVGKMTYEGDLTGLYPYIKAAELFGIGKGTAFGFGRFKVSVEGGN